MVFKGNIRRAIARHLFFTVLLAVNISLSGCGEDRAAGTRPAAKNFSRVAEEIIRQRAAAFAPQPFLVVDYYRIYRKLAYPLPVRRIDHPPLSVEDRFTYPWEIWMTWDLEERVNSLGWAGEWLGDREYRSLVQVDLKALAGWPVYNVWENPHLSIGHAVRMMAGAYRNWSWLDPDLKEDLRRACARVVDNHAEWFKSTRMHLTAAEEILGAAERGSLTHNIPFIATLALSMAARLCAHPLADALERHSSALVLAELELRREGITEGISYDGYILDFIADWLGEAAPEVRSAVLDCPELSLMLSQSALLAVPGDVLQSAPFNDVEPREMPFHASAHAKLARFRWSPQSAWYLDRFPAECLRADALAALHGLENRGPREAPVPGAAEGLYALVLRSGWESDDLAVAVSASNSRSGHIQKDNGTVVIGTRGRWLIDDPGYQQYLEGPEREFTLGRTAHNYPVIDGQTQKVSSVKRLACDDLGGGLYHAAVDITGGYDPSPGLSRVSRHAWLLDKSLVVIADFITGEGVKSCGYCWHAHPEAALWVGDGACLVHLDSVSLWIQCPNRPLDGSEIKRLPGTRGQISILADLETGSQGCIWWIFNLGSGPARYTVSEDGLALDIAGRRLSVAGQPQAAGRP
ncbi:MAG: heparinase II/III family protein, partial [Candidatus Glassbacteria bacterium]|nr:heparinase II/III family protein [Candidatus Glassbacteria bacterium]